MKNKSLNLKTKQLLKKAVSFVMAAVMVITILPLQPMTAHAEETPEVLWGTSADSLTNSGTWEQLYNILNTEKENTSINYVKANKSDVVVLYELPVYKELTVDIAGHNLHLLSGGFISAKVPDVTVTVLDTAENDGTLMGDCTRIISIDGTLNLEGGKFENNLADGAVITSGGPDTCVDISRHPDPEGITINYLMAELSEENFKNQFNLPEDYAWFDSENNAVTAMKPYGIYTVGKSSGGITYNVTVNYTIGGGDVTAQPSSATEGTAVTISVSPYYNRELVSLKVKQGDTEIPVTDNQFIMPAGDVVIYPEFRIINPTIEVTAADGTVTLTDTFWQAMAAVENSTSLATTVKLLDNITIPTHEHDVSKGVFTFNLNGKTINGGGAEAALNFGTDTQVVITGNGTVENAVNAIKTASDSLTIENGNFTGTKNAINICGGNTTINSGTFTVDYNSGSETAVNLTGGKAVINGGSFTSVSVALNIEYSEAEVNGGTFTAPNAISIYIDGKLSISGNASIDGECFDINNSSFGTPVIITSEIDANAPISLITGYAGAPLAKGADGITLNPDWFASADPGKIIYYNQTDNTIYLKECTHSWSEDNTCAICGITGYGVYIKGIHINELNAEDVLGDGTVSYNAQTATLTLSGADISNSDNSHSLEIDKGDITLVLIGENSLGAGDENHFAVWIENGASLTVSENSTGSLTAPTGLKATDNYGYLSQEKIYVNRSITGGGDFTVKGGTVSGSIFMGGDIAITGGTVNADYLAAENVTVTGGSVTADGKANIEYYDINAPYGTYGIYADNNILISGGTVTASGGYASANESALKLNSISKATATAAMYAGNAIDITGGTVTATGGRWNNYVPDPLGFMKLGSYTATPSDFVKPDTVIDLYGKALKAQSFTISDNAVFICGSDTTHDMQCCAGDAENTIAYKCVFCGKTAENITATVNAEDAVYNGSAYNKASVVYGDSWSSSKNLVITYTGTTFGGEDYNSTTAPSAAGEYTASVAVGGVTASAQFTISKATLTADDFTFTPPVERVYDGEEKQATVATDKTGMGEITVHYYNSDGEEAAPVDAGTYTVKIDVTESENYSAVTGLTDNYWTFSIQKADPVFTAPQAIENLAYTGQPQVLITPGTSDHGTFMYSVNADENSPELPTGTEVRSYDVSWYLKGDKNHFNSSTQFLSVTISTADQQQLIITGIPDTVTYGDTFKLSATGGDGQGGMSWAVSRGGYNATIDQQGNVTVKGTGDFTVTLIRYGDRHYNDASVSHTFTSQPKQLTDAVVSVDGGLVYNGAPHTPAVTVTLDGVTLEENTDYTLEYNNNINASAQATVTVTGMGNYAGTVTKNFTVDKAEPTADMFTVTYPSDMVYDGNAKTVTATVKAGFTGVGDILVKYYDENGYLVNQAVNAGKYTVKLSVSEGENYHATQEPIFPTDGSSWEFEITKVTAAVTTAPTANQLTYDGTAQALVTAGTTDGGKFAYSLSEDGQYSETIPTGITAGEYTVWYYIVGDGNHFNSAKSFVKVTVGKADQQIEIKDIPATVTYGDAFKLSAQLGEGSMDTSWSIESGADNATIDGNGNIAVTGAGDFTVTLTSHGQQNYSDKTVSHTFTAQKKQLTVAEVIAEDKFYNGKTDATIEEITLRGIVNEDSVVALGTAQFADKNAGVAKPVTITGLTLKGSAAENYTLDVTTVETTADIIPALIKVAPKSGQSKVYGTADGEFTYEITVGKLYGDDKLTGALGREEGETVGEYAYTIGTLANSDYNIALEATDKFEIVKGTPEYTAPTGLSATYGDTLAKVKLPEGWAWKDETTTSVGDIGENKFTAIFTPTDTANYNTVEVELTVKVNAKPAEKPVHKHSWSGLKNDNTSHYYECACGAKDEVTAHTYNTSGRCTVCGYYNANAVAKPVVTPTPAPTATPQPTEKPVGMPKEADTTITEAKPTEEAVEAAKDNVTVSEGTAQLNKEAVEAVADAQNEEKEIVLPLTQTTENVVNEAEIYTEALAEIAKDGKDVVIQFTDATVKLEAEAVKALTKQAKGKTIEIRAVIVEAHTLNEHQQEELKDMDYVVIISVQAFSDGEYIGQFRGGKATVMLPFELDSGTKADEYHVYYIDEKGDLHKAASEYIDGYMVFTTVHFSEYIIVHEAAQNDDTVVVTPQQPEQETSFPILPIIIAVTAIVIILIIFKKKKEEEE